MARVPKSDPRQVSSSSNSDRQPLTLATLQEVLAKEGLDSLTMYVHCLKAIRAVMLNKSYTIGGYTFTRENLPELLKAKRHFGIESGAVRPEPRRSYRFSYLED